MNANHVHRRELWPATMPGDAPLLVEYEPVPEPFLLRTQPTRVRYRIYTLAPVANEPGMFVIDDLVSIGNLDTQVRH